MRILTILVVTTLAVGLAAELALIQPGEVAAQLAAKGARPALFHMGPNLLYDLRRGPKRQTAPIDTAKLRIAVI